MRESVIEKKVTDYAKKQGWLSFKWVSPQQNGVPDRLYFKQGRLIIVEFKAPNKEPRKLQKIVIAQLKKQRFNVNVIDDIEQGKRLFDG